MTVTEQKLDAVLKELQNLSKSEPPVQQVTLNPPSNPTPQPPAPPQQTDNGQLDVTTWLQTTFAKSEQNDQVILEAVTVGQGESAAWTVAQLQKGLMPLAELQKSVIATMNEQFEALTAGIAELRKSNAELQAEVVSLRKSVQVPQQQSAMPPQQPQMPQQQPNMWGAPQQLQRSMPVQQVGQNPYGNAPQVIQPPMIAPQQPMRANMMGGEPSFDFSDLTVPKEQLQMEKSMGGVTIGLNQNASSGSAQNAPQVQSVGGGANMMSPNGVGGSGVNLNDPRQVLKSMEALSLRKGSGVTPEDVMNYELILGEGRQPVLEPRVITALNQFASQGQPAYTM